MVRRTATLALAAGLALAACTKAKPGAEAPWLTAPSRGDHERFFPIASGPHAVDCNQCHGASDTFKQFDCLGCHQQQETLGKHPGEPGYAWENPKCYACHKPGAEVVPAAHASFFPIGATSTHALGGPAGLVPGTIGCGSCHTTTDRAQVDCTTCHTEAAMTVGGTPFHASVPDLPPGFAAGTQVSQRCLLCHADAKVPAAVTVSIKAAVHDDQFGFRITPGNLHAGQECLTCHAVTRAISTTPSRAADFSQQTCTACHAPKPGGSLGQDLDATHAGLGPLNGATYQPLSNPPVPADSKSCLRCHASGAVEGFDHSKWFPIGAADTHAMGKMVATSTGATVTVACAACHLSPATRQDVTCTLCHTSAGKNAAGPAAIDLAPAHDGKVGGTAWQASGTPTVQCLLCHASNYLERTAVHGSVSSKWGASDYPGTVFGISTGGHLAACDKCHTAQVTDPGVKNPRLDFAQRSCDACHTEAKDKVVTIHGKLGVTPAVADPTGPNNAGACLKCHADGGLAPASVAWAHAWFPVGATSTHPMGQTVARTGGLPAARFTCTACHVDTADLSKVDCTTCHTQASMTGAAGKHAHSSVQDLAIPFAPGWQTSVATCLPCHADGRVPASLSWSTSKVGTHDALYKFKVTAGAAHDTTRTAPVAERCTTCHSLTKPIPNATTAAGAPIPVIDFKQQTCTACHAKAPGGALAQDVDGLHTGLGTVTINGTAFTYSNLSVPPVPADSQKCLNCHFDGGVNGFDHAGYFPISASSSHALSATFTVSGAASSTLTVVESCSTCHQNPANRQDVTCTACHTAAGTWATRSATRPVDLGPAHAGKLKGTNWQASGAPTNQCLLCHALDFNEAVSAHGSASSTWSSDHPGTTFAIDAANPNHFAACEQCHTGPTLTSAALKNPRLDFNVRTCNGCHTEAKDRLVTIHGQLGVTPTVTDTVDGTGAPVPGHAKACMTCHADGGAAPASVPYTHAFFPVGATSTHPMGKTVTRANGLPPASFLCSSCHVDTADLSKVDCTVCHSQASMTGTGGKHAHSSVQDLAIPFTPGWQTSVNQCLRCHADGKAPVSLTWSTAKVGTHDALYKFKVSAGAAHSTTLTAPVAEKCATCHSITKPVPGATLAGGAAIPVIDFKQQTCTACHAKAPGGALAQDVDAMHAGLGTVTIGGVGYTYSNLSVPPVPADSAKCLNCHADGGVNGFDHVKYFPVFSTSTHALGGTFTVSGSATPVVLACATCHQDALVRKNVTCNTCHTDTGLNGTRPNALDLGPAHQGKVVGTSWRAPTAPTPQCLLCHALDYNEAISAHGSVSSTWVSDNPGRTFLIDATSNPAHYVSCDQCHTGPPLVTATLQNPRADFNTRTCNGCHSEAKDKLVTIHAALSVSPAVADTVTSGGAPVPGHAKVCMTCHADGDAAPASVPYSHAWFPVSGAAVHAMGTQAKFKPGTFQCSSCHTALTVDPTLIDCTACHTQANMTAVGGTSFHFSVPDLVWPGTPNPQATSLLCLKCHADGQTPVSVSFSAPTSTAMGQHDTTNPAIKYLITPNATHSTSNTTRPMNCLTCHSVGAAAFPGVPALAGFVKTDFTQQTCTACHLPTGTLAQDIGAIHANVTTPSPGFTPVPSPVTPAYSKTCLLCHANGQIDPVIAAQNHATFFPINATSSHAYGKSVTVLGGGLPMACATCHTDPAKRSNVDCTGCHVATGNNGTPGSTVPADQNTAHLGKVGVTPANLWLGTGPVGSGNGATASCLRCHALDARPKGYVALHGRPATPGGVTFVIDTSNPSHFVSCEQCHGATLTAPARQNPETDFTKARCTPCHADTGTDSIVTEHAGIPYPSGGFPNGITITGYTSTDANNSAKCLTCHPDGQVAAGFTHPMFPLTSAANSMPGKTGAFGHNTVAKCADCHTPGQPRDNVSMITCRGCHNDLAANTANQNGKTLTQRHRSTTNGGTLGVDIWTIATTTSAGSWSAAPAGSTSTTDSSLCLQCHAGNNVSSYAASRLVMRLAATGTTSGHDARCSPSKKIGTSGSEHALNRNGNTTSAEIAPAVPGNTGVVGAGIPACFVCHMSFESTTTPQGSAAPYNQMSWSRNWLTVKDPTGTIKACTGCHAHLPNSNQQPNPSLNTCP